jgi:hypothetical protein
VGYIKDYLLDFSERMGWVPVGSEIPEAIRSTYKWIDGLSVTEMEIMHAAYRKDNPNGELKMQFEFNVQRDVGSFLL